MSTPAPPPPTLSRVQLRAMTQPGYSVRRGLCALHAALAPEVEE